MNLRFSIISVIALAVAGTMTFPGAAQAAVSAKQAAKLKTTLTPLGATRAGNAAGTIPAWTGGYTKVPAGYKPGDPRPDFFANEKPLFSITAKNMAKYADKLTDGEKAMLKKYPKFRMDIYPTHRTAAAPQWVYDNVFKNATRAKLTGKGYTFSGAYGGIPFPIPQNANEMILNHLTMWKRGSASVSPSRCFVVTPDGRVTMVSEGTQYLQRPFYYKNGSLKTYQGYYNLGIYMESAPASKAGEAILAHDPSEVGKRQGLWQYLVGQRRVRRAPSVSYDTPDSVTSGIAFYDEAFMMFGPWAHHNYKVIGKKEIYVPYNENRVDNAPVKKLFTPHFLNPDLVRWELHRVWVIDATLKPGKRHVVPHRRFYLDEDSWQILLTDGWDAQGKLWRVVYDMPLLAPDIPALVGNVDWGVYDLRTGAYDLNASTNGLKHQLKLVKPRPEAFFSPQSLAQMGLQ